MITTNLRLERSSLGSLTKIKQGGQGIVFDVPRVRLNGSNRAVYKEYLPAVKHTLNAQILERMVGFVESLTDNAGAEFIERASWPLRLVVDSGTVSGFIMPRFPAHFMLNFRFSSGTWKHVSGEFQHLLNDETFLIARGITITNQQRYALLIELASSLLLFHNYGITIGDFSPKNILFSLSPPRTYFVDCDSMCYRGTSALAQVETPGWNISAVSNEELATASADRYKFGLLALRLFAQSQDTRDPRQLPSFVPKNIRQIISATLTATPLARPSLAEWIQQLGVALASSPKVYPKIRPASNATRVATGVAKKPNDTLNPLAVALIILVSVAALLFFVFSADNSSPSAPVAVQERPQRAPSNNRPAPSYARTGEIIGSGAVIHSDPTYSARKLSTLAEGVQVAIFREHTVPTKQTQTITNTDLTVTHDGAEGLLPKHSRVNILGEEDDDTYTALISMDGVEMVVPISKEYIQTNEDEIWIYAMTIGQNEGRVTGWILKSSVREAH